MNLHSSAFPESTATTPEPLFVMKGDMTCVHCILSANFVGERYLCVGTSDGMVHLWNLQVRMHLLMQIFSYLNRFLILP